MREQIRFFQITLNRCNPGFVQVVPISFWLLLLLLLLFLDYSSYHCWNVQLVVTCFVMLDQNWIGSQFRGRMISTNQVWTLKREQFTERFTASKKNIYLEWFSEKKVWEDSVVICLILCSVTFPGFPLSLLVCSTSILQTPKLKDSDPLSQIYFILIKNCRYLSV